jgi:hypothetical protein
MIEKTKICPNCGQPGEWAEIFDASGKKVGEGDACRPCGLILRLDTKKPEPIDPICYL